MRKLLLSIAIMAISHTFLNAQNYVVQVAAFDRYVKLDYFSGLSGIYHLEDHNSIHKYFISGFENEAAAESQAKTAKDLGYNARVIDMDAINALCAQTCGAITIVPDDKIRSIFFGFDKSDLRPASKSELDQLYQILVANPQYSVELSAHTDSKGSLAYNEDLSMRRAMAAKTYLLKKGIPESRIKTSTFGENSPIAKNELSGGVDTPEGRQFNRRVELRIFNTNGTVEPIVEDIAVPTELKND